MSGSRGGDHTIEIVGDFPVVLRGGVLIAEGGHV
jgi:hypothetical protein